MEFKEIKIEGEIVRIVLKDKGIVSLHNATLYILENVYIIMNNLCAYTIPKENVSSACVEGANKNAKII